MTLLPPFRRAAIFTMSAPAFLLSAADPSWSLQYQRVVNGPEGALVVRVGDVDNLGYGWESEKLNPFTGAQTPAHPFPWEPKSEDFPGTDRIMVGAGVVYPRPEDAGGDGYSGMTQRPKNSVVPVEMDLGEVPSKIEAVLMQMFVDDFQTPSFQSKFEVVLDGKPLRRAERILHVLDQTGPVGKLISFRLDREHFADLTDGKLKLTIDDATSGAGDGYALDFLRVLVNPKILHPIEVQITVVDRHTGQPIPGAQVSSSLADGVTNAQGQVLLRDVPAGLVAVEAAKTGYRTGVGLVEVAKTDKRGELVVELEPVLPGKLRVEITENTPAFEPSAALIIFDASGSMLQKMQGARRIDIARETLSTVVHEALPDNLLVGLRVFGEGGPGSCESVLKIPVGPLDRGAMQEAISRIEPVNQSKTPIGASLAAAEADLADVKGSKLVLLLTDGEETCGGDAEKAVAELRAQGLDVRVNIVGFALDQGGLKQTFEKLASLGGGSYFDAGKRDDLAPALRQAFAIPFDVLDASGKKIAQGSIGGEEIALPEGDYTITTAHGGGLEKKVHIPNGEPVTVTLGEP